MQQKLRFQARCVCYTMFDKVPTLGGADQKYHIYGEEICPETKKLHYQGYCEFNKVMSLTSIKKSLGSDTVHVEKRKGNQKQAIDYCKKDGKVTEWGNPKEQGKRGDLIGLSEEILKGTKSTKTIRREQPIMYHQYGRTFDKLEDDYNATLKRNWMTKGIWLWGPTGCGKSRWAYETYPDAYTWQNDKGWQDHYNCQDTIIIDDFRGNIEYAELLKMMDRYDYKLPRRGRAPIPLMAKTIIITSSMPPEKIYRNLSKRDSLDQLFRRCEIREMKLECDISECDRSGQKGNTNLSDPLMTDYMDDDFSLDFDD